MNMHSTLSIVTTTDPQANQLSHLLAALSHLATSLDQCFEVIIVDDLQQWASENPPAADALPGLLIKPILTATREGQLKAIKKGLAQASSPLILTIDPDMHPCASEIPAMMAMVNEVTMAVHAVRSTRSNVSTFRRLASGVVNVLVRMITGLTVKDIGSPVTLFKKEVLAAIPQDASDHQPNLRLKAYLYLGERLACYPLKNAATTKAPSHYDLRQLIMTSWRLLRDAIYLRRNGGAMPQKANPPD